MNIETRVKTLEEARCRQEGVTIIVIADCGETPELTEAIRAAKAGGRAILVLTGLDVDE